MTERASLTSEFDDDYRRTPDLFGSEPVDILVDHRHHLAPAGRVLDIGAGQGRNALYLARLGFAVDAIDPSPVAVEALAARATAEGLPVATWRGGFAEFAPPALPYAGILAFGLIPLLTRAGIAELADRVDRWTAAGSVVFASAFTTADPRFRHYQRGRPCGRNSFIDDRGRQRTFLEEGEILHLFAGFDVLHHWEGLGREHRHGDGPPERHVMAKAVLRRS